MLPVRLENELDTRYQLILYMKRPTHKELDSKIKQALVAARKGMIDLVERVPIVIDAFELGYDVADLQQILT